MWEWFGSFDNKKIINNKKGCIKAFNHEDGGEILKLSFRFLRENFRRNLKILRELKLNKRMSMYFEIFMYVG